MLQVIISNVRLQLVNMTKSGRPVKGNQKEVHVAVPFNNPKTAFRTRRKVKMLSFFLLKSANYFQSQSCNMRHVVHSLIQTDYGNRRAPKVSVCLSYLHRKFTSNWWLTRLLSSSLLYPDFIINLITFFRKIFFFGVSEDRVLKRFITDWCFKKKNYLFSMFGASYRD